MPSIYLMESIKWSIRLLRRTILLFSLEINDNVLSVMLATADYLSENIDLGIFD